MNDQQARGDTGGRTPEGVPGPEATVPTEPAAAGEPSVEPSGESILEPSGESILEPSGQALPITEAPTEPSVDASMPSPADEPIPEALAPIAPAASAPPMGAGSVDGAVDAGSLVPLDDIAPAIVEASVTRRAFLGFGLALVGGLAGAAVLSRLVPIFDDTANAASPVVPTYDPVGKAWTFVVDSSSCIGCGLCVVACKEENHVPEEAEYTRTWVERHTVTSDGVLYVDSPEAGMHGFPPESTAPGAAGKTVASSHFEPRLCMQCENSPCTSVCPVGATYRTADGVILVDARRCIGCGYCVVACPYGARYIVPAGGDSPADTPGVADKCTWCYHRISRGGKPACVEVCPVGARKFGDANDPDSEIATIVREQNPQPLHPEYGTAPRVLYLGPSIEEA